MDNGTIHRRDNDTNDVAIKGCFVGYDAIACLRRSILSFLMVITFILCLIKVGRLHSVQHEQTHHFVIFYLALVECITCVTNWMLSGHYPELDLAATALKILQLVTLCHYNWIQAWRVLQRRPLRSSIWFPIFGSFSTYVIVVTSLGMLDISSSWTECFKPYWLMLSAADFILVQVFLVAGVYITRKINEISTLECVKKNQKKNLWSAIVAFEISAIVGLAFDITVRVLGTEELGCSGIFAHTQLIYSPVFFMFMVFKFCLPVWSLLSVLEPLPGGIPYCEILATSHCRSLAGACAGHASGSPYRVLRSYVFDDNAEILSGSPRSGRESNASTNSESSDFTRQLFAGVSSGGGGGGRSPVPTLFIPGHGLVTAAPVVRSPVHEWTNPRDYMRSRQRVTAVVQAVSTRTNNLTIISEEIQSQVTEATLPVTEKAAAAKLTVDVHRTNDELDA